MGGYGGIIGQGGYIQGCPPRLRYIGSPKISAGYGNGTMGPRPIGSPPSIDTRPRREGRGRGRLMRDIEDMCLYIFLTGYIT